MPRSRPPSLPAAAEPADAAADASLDAMPPSYSPPASASTSHAGDWVYVDGVEDDLARLLIVDSAGEWQAFHLPLRVLPAGVKENTWISLRSHIQPAPPWADSVRSLRERLGRDDDGGDFSL